MNAARKIDTGNIFVMKAKFTRFPVTEHGTLEKPVLREFMSLLLIKADELHSTIVGLKNSTRDAERRKTDHDGFHTGEEVEETLAQLGHEERELAKVSDVLRRLTNDLLGGERDKKIPAFGTCLQPGCKSFIGKERLESMPETPMCENCVGKGGGPR